MVLVLGVGRCAFRPPRVVFVYRPRFFLSNSLTSGKNKFKSRVIATGRLVVRCTQGVLYQPFP